MLLAGFAGHIEVGSGYGNKKSHVINRRREKSRGAGIQTDFEMLGICIHPLRFAYICIHLARFAYTCAYTPDDSSQPSRS